MLKRLAAKFDSGWTLLLMFLVVWSWATWPWHGEVVDAAQAMVGKKPADPTGVRVVPTPEVPVEGWVTIDSATTLGSSELRMLTPQSQSTPIDSLIRSIEEAKGQCLALLRSPTGIIFTVPYAASETDRICWQTLGDSQVCETVAQFRARNTPKP